MTTSLLAAAIALALAGDPESALPGSAKTARFEIRFRSGSRAEASVDRVAARVEGELDRILERLDVPSWREKIRIFLYDDVEELKKITGVASAGHAVPLELHLPHDNDQTRLHEMVHVVAERFSEKGDEPRNLFFAEGLSNAVLEYVHGVHVHAVAAFEKRRGALPKLAEIHEMPDFYAWLGAHPGVNGYDVAGSYMLFLLDAYGAAKVRSYYKGVSAKKAFGADVPALERRWHAILDKAELRPGVEALLRERAGLASSFTKFVSEEDKLTDAILGPKKEWTALAGAERKPNSVGTWKKGAKGPHGFGAPDDGNWSECTLGSAEFGNAIVRIRAVPKGACYGVKVILGQNCQAMLLGTGAFLYNEVGGVAFDPKTTLGANSVEIVLRRSGGRATVWIDGRLVFEADVDGAAAPVTIGVVQGSAEFEEVAVRPLK